MAKTANVAEGERKVKIEPEAAARIEHKLWQGVPRMELGLDLATRFGEIKELERQRDALSREIGNMPEEGPNAHRKWPELRGIERKMKDREYRMAQANKWAELAMEYIIETYGPEKKDSQGYLMGYGEQITFDRSDGHLKRNW